MWVGVFSEHIVYCFRRQPMTVQMTTMNKRWFLIETAPTKENAITALSSNLSAYSASLQELFSDYKIV